MYLQKYIKYKTKYMNAKKMSTVSQNGGANVTFSGYISGLIKNDGITIFYSPTCSYSMRALTLLENSGKPYTKYNLNELKGFDGNVYSITKDYDPSHRTKPIVFINGSFFGGCNELENYLKN
jgi:glutaredoxin